MKRGCALFVLWLAVTACTGSDHSPRTSPRSTPPPHPDSVVFDPATAPDIFMDRTRLPSCGVYVLGQEPVPRAVGRCLRKAKAAGGGAEAAVQRPTVEGDPIVEYLRVLPGSGTVEIFNDSTRDHFGSQRWSRALCEKFDFKDLFGRSCSLRTRLRSG